MSHKPVIYCNAPAICDVCHDPIKTTFIDGATRMGPWANMCLLCFGSIGIGLGLGRGQRYIKQGDGKFLKVEG